MKKSILAGLMIVVVVAALGTANVVFAQGPNPDPEVPGSLMGTGGRGAGQRLNADPLGRMGNMDAEGLGLMEDELIAYAAQELGLSTEEIQSRLDAGETLAEIAVSAGVEDYLSFMQAARDFAREQVLASGVEVPGWMGGKGPNGLNQAPRYNMENCDQPLNLNNDGSVAQPGTARGRWNQQ